MSTEYNEGGTDEFVIGSRGRLSCESCARCNQRIADLETALADAVVYADSSLLIPYTRAKKWKILLGSTKENEV